jgi:tetratricopeptide (TPR) repeat protein
MKRVSRIVIMGVAYGGALLICKWVFKLSTKQVMWLYIWSAAAIIIISALVNLVYNVVYSKKINQLIPLLNEGKCDEYLKEMTAIRDRVKSKHLKNLAQLNLTPALIEKKEYRHAADILEGLEGAVQKFPSAEMVRRLNLCFCYFYLKDYDKAETLYENSKPVFEKFRDHETYHKHFVVLELFRDICGNGNKDEAAERLKEARETYTDKNLIGDFEYLETLL